MKRPYIDIACEEFIRIKEIFEQKIRRVKTTRLIQMLASDFGLDKKQASGLLNALMDMQYIGIPYECLPPPKLFREVKLPSRSNIKDYSWEIRNEKQEIVKTVRRYRKLDRDQQENFLSKWPEEVRPILIKGSLEKADSRGEFDYDFEYDTADTLAFLILAKRWNTTPAVIKKYASKKFADKNNRRLPKYQRLVD